MLRVVVLLVIGLALRAEGATPQQFAKIRKSVFKISTESQDFQPRRPWKMKKAERSTGTGFLIAGGRIMTNAHVVANGKYITVLKDGAERSTLAYVEFVAHDCDLAILKVKDEEYIKGITPLEFGELPSLQSPVETVGYARGGDQVSVTKGIVSRISFRRYVHSAAHQHLLIQVDSAINPGNSGGVAEGKVIGVAFQSYSDAENTGYAIPASVARRFLRDVEDKTYDGHPDDGITIQSGVIANSGVAALHKVPSGQGGVKVVHVAARSPADGVIKVGDIITHVNGMAIGADGRIEFQGERIDVGFPFDMLQLGENLTYRVIRDGTSSDVKLTAGKFSPAYNGANSFSKSAPYLVFGGVVFTVMSRNVLTTWGERWFEKAPLSFRYAHQYSRYDLAFEGRDEVVLLLGVLPHAANRDMVTSEYGVVDTVDGAKVKSLKELKRMLTEASGNFIRMQLMHEVEPLVFDKTASIESAADIQKVYGLASLDLIDGVVDGATSSEGVQ